MPRRPAGLLIALALTVAACSSGESTDTTVPPTTAPTTTIAATTAPTTTTTTTTTTTLPPSTTTTKPGAPSPINGLPVADETLLGRRVLGVKIDNHPNARPQSGLEMADGVIELLVEGGFTRFIALFHTADADYVGPIRSGRPTDPTVLRPFGEATMAFSGGQSWIRELINSKGIRLIGEGPGMFRTGHRRAPHNLYGDTFALRRVADDRGFPDEFAGPLYTISPWLELPLEKATVIDLLWSGSNRVVWEFVDGSYVRFSGGAVHESVDADGVGGQVTVEVLVVLTGAVYTASPAGDGNSVPATRTTGTGSAIIFSEGRVWEGTWERTAESDPFTLLSADGSEMTVPPGRPWISMFPSNQPITWS